ncbi:hypothetical protein IEO21_02711 [Rhodonia placenta]|uniref:NAD(P)-binding protein n=1 Tax=Rhodonia placenta TaxID=104341 RepID=A0A8H7P716_9APHY|nr:hypothetical protein IEO21_02711 [Postia placenta]
MPSYAVIGASRGIGLELVRQLAASPHNVVFAIVRNIATSTHLTAFVTESKKNNVHVLQADVADHVTLKVMSSWTNILGPALTGHKDAAARAAEITGGSLDVLIHSAARIEVPTMFKRVTDYEDDKKLEEDFLQYYKVNTVGVVHSINAFLPLLRKGTTRKIVVLSSHVGERNITWDLRTDVQAAFGASKAATHMILTKYAVLLESEGFTVVGLLPGIVDVSATAVDAPLTSMVTDIGPLLAKFKQVNPDFDPTPLTLENGTRSLLEAIYSFGPADTGTDNVYKYGSSFHLTYCALLGYPFFDALVEDMINLSGIVDDKIVPASGKIELLSRILPKFFATDYRGVFVYTTARFLWAMQTAPLQGGLCIQERDASGVMPLEEAGNIIRIVVRIYSGDDQEEYVRSALMGSDS